MIRGESRLLANELWLRIAKGNRAGAIRLSAPAFVYFEAGTQLYVDPVQADEQEGTDSNDGPQSDALQKWTYAHLL